MQKRLFIFLLLCSGAIADVWDGYPVVIWPIQNHLVNNDGRNDGVNVQKTAEAMHDLGATTFTYHVTTESAYNGLINTLKSFKDTDIKTWAVVGPRCWFKDGYEPFYMDCVAVAEAFAELSLEYPNFELVIFDDYYPLEHNPVGPEHITSAIDAKNEINPEFNVIPTMYPDSWDGIKYFRDGTPIGDEWGEVFSDGTTMWYWASFKGEHTINAYKEIIDEQKEEIPPIPYMSGYYIYRSGELANTLDVDLLHHDPQILYESIKYAKENSDGIGFFDSPLFVYDMEFFMESTMFKHAPNDDSSFDYMVSSEASTMPSWYQEMKTTVPASGNVRVQFDMRDSRSDSGCDTSSLYDYQFKQLVVNDEVVWDSDICSDGTSRVTIDKTIAISGNSADIEIRLFSKKSHHIKTKMYIDDPKVYVNGNLVSADWKFDTNLSKLDEYVATYNALKSALNDGEPPIDDCGNGVCDASECSNCRSDCAISDCNSDGYCRSGYKDGDENCDNSADCSCEQREFRWNMTEAAGKIMDNINHIDLDIFGNPQWIDGPDGQAMVMDGDDYISHPDDDMLDTMQMTFMVRVRPDEAMEGTFRGIAAKADEDSADWSWQLRYTPDGSLGFQINDESGPVWTKLDSALEPGNWYHITARYDGSEISIFLDGEKISSTQADTIRQTDSSFYIGQEGWGNGFIGAIDDAHLLNYALTDEAIREHACNAPSIDEIVAMIQSWLEGEMSMNIIIQNINRWRNGCS